MPILILIWSKPSTQGIPLSKIFALQSRVSINFLILPYFSMVLFHCSFCSFVSELIENTKELIIEDHKNWKAELKDIGPVSKLTPHTYSNWLADLTGDFKQLVISKCSQRARDAVDCDENIQVCNQVLLISVLIDLSLRTPVPGRRCTITS